MVVTETTLVNTFAECIAHEAGWFKTGKIPTVAQRLNNPLALEHWKDPRGVPYPDDYGFVEFPDEVIGWRCGRSQCRINIIKRQLTFRQFFQGKPGTYKGFSPADGTSCGDMRKSDPVQSARNVLARINARFDTSATIDTPIFTLLSTGVQSERLAA